tara:strand:- start:109 stop:519 length:411 start_codon:yes stop_codon:yes gene_type:complete
MAYVASKKRGDRKLKKLDKIFYPYISSKYVIKLHGIDINYNDTGFNDLADINQFDEKNTKKLLDYILKKYKEITINSDINEPKYISASSNFYLGNKRVYLCSPDWNDRTKEFFVTSKKDLAKFHKIKYITYEDDYP